MGVAELAAAAVLVTLVGPYVAKGAEELAKKVGGEVGGRVVKLWDALRAKLAGKEALTDVEAKPEDPATLVSVRGPAGEGDRSRSKLSRCDLEADRRDSGGDAGDDPADRQCHRRSERHGADRGRGQSGQHRPALVQTKTACPGWILGSRARGQGPGMTQRLRPTLGGPDPAAGAARRGRRSRRPGAWRILPR